MALPNNNITTVKNALGETKNTLSGLCTSNKINFWSKWCPIPLTNNNGPATQTDMDNRTYTIPSYSNARGLTMNFIYSRNDTWSVYRTPNGTTEPYRLGDYRNYNHTASNPLGTVTVVTLDDGGPSKNFHFEFRLSTINDTNTQVGTYSVYNGAQFGIIIFKQSSGSSTLTPVLYKTMGDNNRVVITRSNSGVLLNYINSGDNLYFLPVMSSAAWSTIGTDNPPTNQCQPILTQKSYNSFGFQYFELGLGSILSYVQLLNDAIIEFNPSNTPIANFGTTINTASLTINGQNINKDDIKFVKIGVDYGGTISIGADFLSGCVNLTSIDLSGLTNVTSIGDRFLAYCYDLTSVDLSGLNNVTSIGDDFLYYCGGLTSVDLSGLSNVTSIRDNFLWGSGLTSVDLSPLSKVKSIGSYFLYSCRSLTSLDLSPLSNVTSIGDDFLSGCYNLTSVDLSGLSKVTSIGVHFLIGCSGLTSVDLSGLSNLTSIGDWFLRSMGTISEVKMGAITPPTLGGSAFNNTTVQSIKVPYQSMVAYKTAGNWSDKASIISGYYL